MKIALVHPSKVVPYARNPRKNQASIANVAASIKEFGFRQPIVVDSEMVIVNGATRYQGAWEILPPSDTRRTTGVTRDSTEHSRYRI